MTQKYDDMWTNRIPITDFVRKYFKTTGDLMASEKNIAYTNIGCKSWWRRPKSRRCAPSAGRSAFRRFFGCTGFGVQGSGFRARV